MTAYDRTPARGEHDEPRGLARILVDRLARNSIRREPPGFPDPHGMLTVADPQVPTGDRELLRDQEPVLNEHVWRLAENAAVHERARQQGANAQALVESLGSLIEHTEWLSARVHQALSNAPAGGQEAAGAGEDPATAHATQDLGARQAGTQVFLNELRGEDQRKQGSAPWERTWGAERLARMDGEVTLPSGKTTGAEMNRWVREQD